MKKIITLSLLAISSLFLLSACFEKQDGKYKDLAMCLTEKGVKMYGAFWCSHCGNQKKMFGDDVKYITYIECDARGKDADPEACKTAGVESYPTWTFPGQEPIIGEVALSKLAERANCLETLPESDKPATDTPPQPGEASPAEQQ